MSITQSCQRENTLSQEAFHASRTAMPALKEALETSAIYGLNVGECYASYDPERHCLKTSQDYLFPMEGDSLTESCLTFTDAGLMQNGNVYELRTSGHHILESVFGLSVTRKRLPTPRASDKGTPGLHGKGGMDLRTAVSLWPTPTANDAKNSLTESQRGRGTLTACLVETGDATNGQLNAEFVEWLMGYPLGYTDIENDTPIGGDYGKAVNISRKKTLSLLRDRIGTQEDKGETGRQECIQESEILQSGMFWDGKEERESNRKRIVETGGKGTEDGLRNMQHDKEFTDTPCRRKQEECEQRKLNDALYFLPYKMALGTWENYDAEEKAWLEEYIKTGNRWHSEWPHVPRIITGQKNRVKRLKGLGNAVVPQIPMLIWILIGRKLLVSGGYE